MVDKNLGITKEGISYALDVKEHYKKHEPISVPGEKTRLLMPEHLLNRDISLDALEDPLPLALMGVRDPEAPMAMAAVARLSPVARDKHLVSGVMEIVSDSSQHEEIKRAIATLSEHDFSPRVVQAFEAHTNKVVVQTRKQFNVALRENLHALLDGDMAPRAFVKEFFELTENGNLRSDIRKRLVSSLLLSPTIRPGIKFLFLENFDRFPEAVRFSIIKEVLHAPEGHHAEVIKEELSWIIKKEAGGGVIKVH